MKPLLVTTGDLAEFFGCDVRTIQIWAADEEIGMPKMERDKYDFIQVMKWKIRFLEHKNFELQQGGERLATLKMREQELKNKRAEIELKKSLGKVIEKKPALIAWSNQVNVVKSQVNSLRYELIVGLELNDVKTKKANDLVDGCLEIIANVDIEKFIINEEALIDAEELDKPEEVK
jgi:hypothetical protein